MCRARLRGEGDQQRPSLPRRGSAAVGRRQSSSSNESAPWLCSSGNWAAGGGAPTRQRGHDVERRSKGLDSHSATGSGHGYATQGNCCYVAPSLSLLIGLKMYVDRLGGHQK